MIDIDHEHRDYRDSVRMRRRYRDLYTGGEVLKAHADQFLTRRQKEPQDVYFERLSRVFYENYIGSIIDWYAATLFRREPAITADTRNEGAAQYFSSFSEDCDRKGTRLTEFLKQNFIDMLVTGEGHILVDFPRAEKKPANRGEEESLGLSRAFVAHYDAEDLINWSLDDQGDYEWVVLRRSSHTQVSADSPETIEQTFWYYYDKQSYRVFKRVAQAGAQAPIVPISAGTHGMARLNKVPLITMRVSHGLWLMNKSALLQVEHLNKSNALGWAITMGLFAMPVIYSDREWNQVVGESYYIQLGPQDRFGWTEPDGRVFEIAAKNLADLKDEIYRVCYMSQAAGDVSGGASTSSALSKLRDFAITQEVLRSYGDTVKETMRRLLGSIAGARADAIKFSISGFDEFDIGDFATELTDAQKLLGLGVRSPTLQQQVLKYLSDARQDIKDQISSEIDEQFSKQEEK
jgi:hypothetical protein